MNRSKTLAGKGFHLGARAILTAALAAAFLAAASPAAAATWVVNTTADLDTAQCPSICSLRNAMNQASSGDTVVIPAGHYVLILPPPDQVISIPYGLTLVGADARTTVVDGNGHAIFIFHLPGSDTLSISGLSFVNAGGESAIEVTGGGGLQLTAVTIANNNNDGHSSNGKGGGVYAHDTNGVFIDSCTFSNNFALQGGGIYAENIGGALIIDSTFFGNSADSGGSAIQAVNVTGNIGLFLGLTTIGDTLTANTSSPALAVNLATAFSAANTIIAGNPGGGCSIGGTGSFSLNDLDGDGSCGFTGPGSLTGVDPRLGPLANNGGPTDTAALLAGSPAIDAGNDGICSAFTPTDQRGVSRPQGPHCDMGAYELESPRNQIADLIAQVNALVAAGKLAQSNANPLINTLQNAAKHLDNGQSTQTCKELADFIKKVGGDIQSGKIAAADGQPLIDAATLIRTNLGC